MESFYLELSQLLQDHPRYRQMLSMISHYSTYSVMIVYPLVLLYLLMTHSPQFLFVMIRPLVAFVLVTVFRKIINRPRPYDVYDLQVVEDHKHGESFPSRHSVSALIIALVCFKVNAGIGIIMSIMAVIVMVTRLLGCLHFVSDIVAAIIFAVVIAWI